jgi:hypothetical protein
MTSSDTVTNYTFSWMKQVGSKEVEIGSAGYSGPEFVEEVWIPINAKSHSYGLLLRLSDIQADANYTCKVEDLRHKDLPDKSSLICRETVTVYLAESKQDVCPEFHDSGWWWPQTKKVMERERCKRSSV